MSSSTSDFSNPQLKACEKCYNNRKIFNKDDDVKIKKAIDGG